ncbi:hypothetical protein, partial [Desulfosarcina sp.]|uniref:hypothetical protein n=1 Tax=Desulfosarcina sp. TaxID=2027861 RepID=UPI0029B5B05D
NTAIVELAADSRQMSSRYSGLCAAISNAEDVVIRLRRIKIGKPNGFSILKSLSDITHTFCNNFL